MIGAHASGLTGLEPDVVRAPPPPRARNPILEPDEEIKSTRRAFKPIQSGHADLFDGHHKARGPKVFTEGGAGLASARQGEILFPEAPPRRAHATLGEGAAGLTSHEPFEMARGKGRPVTPATAVAAESRNPVLLEGYGDDQLVDYTRFTPRDSASQLASALGPDLLPVQDAEVRAQRRPGTANASAHGAAAADALNGYAGASSSQLHRREFDENSRGRPHPTTEAALAALHGESMSELINYKYSNGISDSRPVGSERAAEQAAYLEQLKVLHEERAENERLYEKIKARVSAPSLEDDGQPAAATQEAAAGSADAENGTAPPVPPQAAESAPENTGA